MSLPDQSHLLPYARRSDFKVSRASELSGKDRRFFRFLEMAPGMFAWLTIVGIILASMYAPFFAAYFIIAFSIFWVLKTIFLSFHVRHNWKRLKHHMDLDWERLIQRFSYSQYYHLVIFPFYKEPREVLEGTLQGLVDSKYDSQKLIVILAAEERACPSARFRPAVRGLSSTSMMIGWH